MTGSPYSILMLYLCSKRECSPNTTSARRGPMIPDINMQTPESLGRLLDLALASDAELLECRRLFDNDHKLMPVTARRQHHT